MERDEQIRRLLKEMAAEVGPDNTMLAKVRSVSQPDMTARLYDEDTGLEWTVRLRPVLDGKESLTIIPRVGTWVLAIRVEYYNEWMILSCGEADKWRLKVGQTVFEQDLDGLLVQKDSDTLKEALQLIIEAVQVIVVTQGTNPNYAKLTEAMAKVNNLLR